MRLLKSLGILVIGIFIGVVALILVLRAGAEKEEVAREKAQMDFALERLSKTEANLGVRCLDVDQLLAGYMGDVSAVLSKMRSGEKLTLEDPIFEKDRRILTVTTDCTLEKNILDARGSKLFKDVVWGRDLVRQDLHIVSLSLHQATVEWCEEKCLADATSKATDAANNIQQQISNVVKP